MSGVTRIFKTVQFVWFVGHAVALTAATLYLIFSLRLFRSSRAATVSYRATYVAIVTTFGIIIDQVYRGHAHSKSKPITLSALVRDDNVQYIALAALWLFSVPSALTLPPFLIFSTFHVLTYARTSLLLALGLNASASISVAIANFVKNYSDRFMVLAASAEFFLLLRLLTRFVLLQRNSVIPFLVFSVFFKLRFDNSAFTRNIVKVWESRVDSVANRPGTPAFLQGIWRQIKHVIRISYGAFGIPRSKDSKSQGPRSPTKPE